jgi:hypothetical protein
MFSYIMTACSNAGSLRDECTSRGLMQKRHHLWKKSITQIFRRPVTGSTNWLAVQAADSDLAAVLEALGR